MMNILIVDDEVEIAEEMGELLESPDRRICLANSGAEALVLAEGVDFDLVITDMRMPGMDGADLVRHLDAKSPGAIRYLIISGHLDTENDLVQLHDISYQLLSKPVDLDELIDTVDGSLDR